MVSIWFDLLMAMVVVLAFVSWKIHLQNVLAGLALGSRCVGFLGSSLGLAEFVLGSILGA